LVEVGNALSAVNRCGATEFIQRCYRTSNIQVVSVDTALLMAALDLYQSRPDKDWGLTDCISFVVMQQQGLVDAVTSDPHFRQAGFRTLMA
jgi:predicted nucleic acid-binding protein